MKKIIFGITGLTLGGAERVLVDIANKLVDKYDVTIFTIYAKGELEKELSSKVKLKTIYNKKYNDINILKRKLIPLYIFINKSLIYRKYIKGDYDVEIAFLEGPITRLFTGKNKKTKKIVWIHNDISKVFGKGIKSLLKRYFDKNIYKKYKKIILVSEENFKNFNDVYKINVPKEIIYNYIDRENVIKKSNLKIIDVSLKEMENNKCKTFLTVARLVNQKAIDRLIRVHYRLIKEGYFHNFYIIGAGPEKERLEKMINDYNVAKSFKLLGLRENPYPYIKAADYFCLLSYFEGYGMVIEEAKILSKNIIITNTAAIEAVNNYKNSLVLENNEDAIYEGLKKVILKEYDGKETLNEKYDNSYLLDEIKNMIENI